MDKARSEVAVLLRGLRGSGDVVAGDVDAAIVEVLSCWEKPADVPVGRCKYRTFCVFFRWLVCLQ